MSEENPFQEKFTSIISDYIETYSLENPVIPNYQIVENMALAYKALRPFSTINNTEINSYNGITVAPENVGEEFNVLLNRNVFLENIQNNRMDWVGTIAHETTHVQDFSEYAAIVSATKYDVIEFDQMFSLWSEINARSKGYFFVRKYTMGDSLYSRKQVPDIVHREIPYQFEMLFKKYHATNNGSLQTYWIAQYLGRLYTLQQLLPLDFTDDWIRTHLGDNKWMSDWYFFFQRYPLLSKAAPHFEEMREILRQNFSGI